jgi:hypothetical protein
MMTYIKVEWLHDDAAYPVLLYSELDEERRETRKAEGFRDGSWCYADCTESVGDSRLGERPLPSIDEIASNPEFRPCVITKEEFESAWDTARRKVTPEPVSQRREHGQLPLRRA